MFSCGEGDGALWELQLLRVCRRWTRLVGCRKGVEAGLQLPHHGKSLLLTEPGDMVSTVRDTTASNYRQGTSQTRWKTPR